MQDLPLTFQPSGPSDFAIEKLEMGQRLPQDYLQFMLAFNGGEGFIGEHYLLLWQLEDLQELNQGYGFSEFAPELIAFGSDGGGEAFAFDTSFTPASIVVVPFIGMCNDNATWVAASFDGFLVRLKNNPNLFQGG
jgi:hypothetical protein